MAKSKFLRLLDQPVFIKWAMSAITIRFANTMNLLSMVLVGEFLTGEVANGAMLAGVVAMSAGLSARFRGQQLDRSVLRSGLIAQVTQTAIAQIVMAVLAFSHAPLLWCFPVAVVIGVCGSALDGGLRALLIPSVPESLMEAASAANTVVIEMAFVAGPSLAGILALVMPSPFVVAVQATFFIGSTFLLSRLPYSPPNNVERDKGKNPLFIKGAYQIYLFLVIFGISIGIYEALIAKVVTGFGWTAAMSGPVGAVTSFGSGIGGVVAVNLSGSLRLGRPLVGLLWLVMGLAYLSSGLAPSPWIFIPILLFIGLPIAPLMNIGALTLQNIVPKRQHSEAFALFSATIMIFNGVALYLTGLFINAFPQVGTMTIWRYIAVLPLLATVLSFGSVLIRRSKGKPQGLGFPLDPDIKDPEQV